MQVFRFMSIAEFRKYLLGYNLKNDANHHQKNNSRTNSIGFCFFNIEDFKPEEILHSLTGIVSCQVCAIFEVENNKLKKTWGRYSKTYFTNIPINAFNNYNELIKSQSFIANEYCITEYNKNTFKLLKYTIPDWYNRQKWEWRFLEDAKI